MLSLEERREEILELINNQGRVRVSELSKKFGISEVSIRIDLDELETKGLVERVHGGAISSYRPYYNMDFAQRSKTNEQEKRKIASAVAGLIKDGSSIFMNSGTTPLFVLHEMLNHKNITIVTYSIALAMEAIQYSNFNPILLGGSINQECQFTYGHDTVNALNSYRVDTFILSLDGVDAESGLTTYYNQESETCRQMIKRAGKTIVVADHTKIGRVAFSGICGIKEVDYIITDKSESVAEAVEALASTGVEIMLI